MSVLTILSAWESIVACSNANNVEGFPQCEKTFSDNLAALPSRASRPANVQPSIVQPVMRSEANPYKEMPFIPQPSMLESIKVIVLSEQLSTPFWEQAVIRHFSDMNEEWPHESIPLFVKPCIVQRVSFVWELSLNTRPLAVLPWKLHNSNVQQLLSSVSTFGADLLMKRHPLTFATESLETQMEGHVSDLIEQSRSNTDPDLISIAASASSSVFLCVISKPVSYTHLTLPTM